MLTWRLTPEHAERPTCIGLDKHNMRTASVLVLCASLLVVADRPPKGDPTECEGAPPHMRRPAAGQCRLLREPRNGCGGSAQLREEDSAAGSEKYACEA